MSGVAKMGRRRRAASGKVSGLFAAIRIVGWGDCTGFGTTRRSRAWKYFPWNEKLVWVHACWMKSSDSSKRSRLSSCGMSYPA